jgi:outer membrane protein assembly factor BamB
LTVGCGKKIVTVSEVSTDVESKPVFNVENDDKLVKVGSNTDNIVLFYEDGKIISYKAKDFSKKARFQVVAGIKKPIKEYGDIVVFKDNNGIIHLFDMKKMEVVYTLKKTVKNIIFADKELMVYGKEKKITIYNYIEEKVSDIVNVKFDSLSDCIVYENKILLCSADKVFEFSKPLKKIINHNLRHESDSGFLIYDDSLYYCSKDMELIRFNLKNDKIVWKLKLPSKIVYKPLRAGRYIGVLLRDYNVYFYNKNGSLYWWEKLGTAPFLQPVGMNENIAVSLRPKVKPSIKFFNIKEKKTLNYQLTYPFNNYFFCNGGIYTVSSDDYGNLTEISKIENKYAVDVKILPKSALVKNKTVEFVLKAINLIKPSFKITIFGSDKKSVFSYEIGKEEPQTFIWLPKNEGDFELIIEACSENKEVITQKIEFNVLNINKMLNDYYYKLFLENAID